MSKTCNDCRYFLMGLDGRPYCTRFPPTCFLIPGQGINGPLTVGSYTPINPAQPCGEHRARATMSGEVVQFGGIQGGIQEVPPAMQMQAQSDPGDETPPRVIDADKPF